MSTCKQFPQIPIVEYSIVCSVIARDQKGLVTRDQNLLKKKKKKSRSQPPVSWKQTSQATPERMTKAFKIQQEKVSTVIPSHTQAWR